MTIPANHGLSSGDCSCLTLAWSLKLPAVTAERAWDKFDIGVRVVKMR